MYAGLKCLKHLIIEITQTFLVCPFGSGERFDRKLQKPFRFVGTVVLLVSFFLSSEETELA